LKRLHPALTRGGLDAALQYSLVRVIITLLSKIGFDEMSDRLAIASAFSVLMMSCFVLFGQGSARADFRPARHIVPISVSAPAMPSIPALLPRVF
jgi:hypothetical protein